MTPVRPDGLWHPRLLELLASSGHGDLIVIADAGLPVPVGVESIDLVWRRGEPGFIPVLTAVLDECVVEHATLADELVETAAHASIAAVLDGRPVEYLPHERLKQLSARARAIVRTGATTPYANVVLRCGVAF